MTFVDKPSVHIGDNYDITCRWRKHDAVDTGLCYTTDVWQVI